MAEPFFRALVARSRDAIVTIDSESTIRFANDGVERTLGHDPDELEGECLTEVMPERHRDRHLAALEQYLSEGERELDWTNVEFPALHADGHEVPLSIAFEEHEYQGERVFSGIMRAISNRIEREERLERKNEQLDRFTAVVTHDLRDPLNTAQATLSLLETQPKTGTARVHPGPRVGPGPDGHHQGVLTLTKSGQVVGESQPVDLATVAERAWDIAGGEDASLGLRTEGMTLETDPERLRALLENLLRNSVAHAEDGGAPSTARVEAGPLRGTDGDANASDSGSDTPTEPTGCYVAVDGCGIPEADREAVFERGHPTTDEGTGLGPSIVRAIAEAHGREVRLTESEAGGARFEFHLADT